MRKITSGAVRPAARIQMRVMEVGYWAKGSTQSAAGFFAFAGLSPRAGRGAAARTAIDRVGAAGRAAAARRFLTGAGCGEGPADAWLSLSFRAGPAAAG